MTRWITDAAIKIGLVMGTAVLVHVMRADTHPVKGADAVGALGSHIEMMFQPEGVFWR